MAESSPPGGTRHLRCLHAGTATPRRGPGQGSGDDPLGSLCCQGPTQGPSILLLVCLWELRELGDGNTSDKWARGGHSYAQTPSEAASRVRHLHAPLPLLCLLHFSWAAKLARSVCTELPSHLSYPGLLRQAQEEGLRPALCPPGPLGAPGHPPVRSVVSPALFSLPIAVTAVSPALLPCPTGTGGPGRGSTAMGMGQKLPFCAHRPADEQNAAKHKCGRQTG